ncbi:tetraspanin-8-like isoform X2 [Fundulus heteroclitus]|uniref:tetraspanin-8-like isoform X2 n=1 Tax=Fundulus heteroclitus TaxID=8078 RepID=UPI00165A4538|nr:tetraspanin-8-like isoform X2 [Fundulus heteroclitus]
MGKINECLKWVFIFFNFLFLIFGCVMIYLAVGFTVVAFQTSAFGGPGVGWLWVIAICFFGISSLGIYAACSEKSLFLNIFAGFIGVGMIIMLILGIVTAVSRNTFEKNAKEIADIVMKNNISRAGLDNMQQQFQCCGVISADDWGTKIPKSCECVEGSSGKPTCKSKPVGTTGPDKIYAKGCMDTIFSVIDADFKVSLGIFFGFGITALMGLLISLLMSHQVKRHDGMGGLCIG